MGKSTQIVRTLSTFSIFILEVIGKPMLRSRRSFLEGRLSNHDEARDETSTIGTWGFDVNGQDNSVRPGDDFFQYANGKYVDAVEIPADRTRWGWFDILANESETRVRAILEADTGSKAGKFYSAYMNEALVETLGLAPLEAALTQVKSFKNKKQFAALVGKSCYGLFPTPIGLWIQPDPDDTDTYAVSIDQGGLGLPSRDYYLDEAFAAKKDAYRKYIGDMLKLIGWSSPDDAAKQVLTLEDSIAKVSWSQEEMRDPVKTHNVMPNVGTLKAQAPGFDWDAFLDSAAAQKSGGLPGSSKLFVGALSGVAGIADILGKADLEVLRAWTAFHLTSSVAGILPKRFVDTAFNFNKVLSGAKELSPRWKRAVDSVNRHLGESVGKLYVERYFPQSSKLKMEGLTQELKRSFKSRIQKLDWMSPPTKKKALQKLESLSIQVGYPKKWKNYDSLVVNQEDLVGNIERAVAFDWFDLLGKMDKPVDRDEWFMNVHTVNAYNEPSFNSVVFPAAILQPPFFDPQADMAVNYGGIGSVIGHEMTHSFDDQGRQYDAHGRLNDWWTQDDADAFSRRAQKYGKQFASFDLGVDKHINPNLTMGENIADLGGLTMALEAFRNASASGRLSASSSGKEGDRRFFFGWAQVWRDKQRKDSLINQLVTDPHSPVEARVDISTRNLDAWYDAFDVHPGEKQFLAKDDRVSIW